jgi:hypothetical protein
VKSGTFFEKKEDNVNPAIRAVYKAFLIKGGTSEGRKHKCTQLTEGDALCAYISLEKEDEIVVVFRNNPKLSLKGITFEEAKKCVGETKLDSDFITNTFDGDQPKRGIIDISLRPIFGFKTK